MKHDFHGPKDHITPQDPPDSCTSCILSYCKTCKGGEAELSTECPGRPLTETEAHFIAAGTLDFIHGAWWRPKLEPEVIVDGVARKVHYGTGKQPWDTMVSNGWAAIFAAGCVIKYLRRTKTPEEDRTKAIWYMQRLLEMKEDDEGVLNVYVNLFQELTDSERLTLQLPVSDKI